MRTLLGHKGVDVYPVSCTALVHLGKGSKDLAVGNWGSVKVKSKEMCGIHAGANEAIADIGSVGYVNLL